MSTERCCKGITCHAIGGTAVLAAMLVLALGQSSASAQGGTHGIALTAGCEPTTCVGQPLLCNVIVTRNDTCGDAIEVHATSHAHIDDPGHLVPFPLWIIAASGNTTAVGGTPLDHTIYLGAPGDTNFGLPGLDEDPSVTLGFLASGDPDYIHIAQPDQVGNILTTFHIMWQDTCDSFGVEPPCEDCPEGIEFEATAGAVTRVSPEPTCQISGPELVCPGQQEIMYTAAETSEPPIAGSTFAWEISGDALFCDGSTTAEGDMVCVNADQTCDGSFTLTVTVTTPDGCINTCTYTVSVDDNLPPIVICADDETIECPATPEFTPPTVSDECDPNPTVSFEDVTTPGDCPQAYSVTRTWTATDFCGNSASCSQTISVVDTTPPTISGCPMSQQLDCDAPYEFTVTCSDECGECQAVCTLTAVDPPGAALFEDLGGGTYRITFSQSGSATITCTAVDDCGNAEECSADLTADCAVGEGCTPGYWKQPQHFGNWPAPYTPDELFTDAGFEDAFPDMTLLEVLSQGGGGLNALGRHTVAALLNAASPDVDYDLTAQDVIDMFNAVFPGTKAEYEELKDIFAGFNEQNCPLGRAELSGLAASPVATPAATSEAASPAESSLSR
jgi:hypothetical protein